MKRTMALVACLIGMLTAINAQQNGTAGDNEQQPVLQTIEEMGLPVLQIETLDGEEPTCDYINPPEGAMGQSITNATKVPGRVVVRKDGQTIYDSGDYVKSTSGMTVKIRGNTSAYGI